MGAIFGFLVAQIIVIQSLMKINKKSSGSLFKKIFCLRGLEVGTNGVLGSLRN